MQLKDGVKFTGGTWSSSNAAIATVSGGSTRGVSPGDVTITDTFGEYPLLSQVCGGPPPNSCPGQPIVAGSGGTVQVATYFGPTGYAAVSGDCAEGTVGTFINVSDQILDQNGNLMQISGVTPEELVCIAGSGCQTSYHTFSTPPSSTTGGAFNDTPIGTCFGPPAPTTNMCVTVSVKYQAYIFGPTNNYPITTVTNRTDCVQGEQDQISSNPTGYNQTYKSGTVP
jgi:hypothetical protein